MSHSTRHATGRGWTSVVEGMRSPRRRRRRHRSKLRLASAKLGTTDMGERSGIDRAPVHRVGAANATEPNWSSQAPLPEGHRAVHEFTLYYNTECPHQGIDNELIAGRSSVGTGDVEVRERLGGMLKHHHRAA